MADQIRVQGNTYDFGSITVKVDGEKFTGFTGLKYGQKRERTLLYGMGRHRVPRGKSGGKYAATASLQGPVDTCDALRKKLADMNDGENYGDTEFLITAEYIEKEKSRLIEIVDCSIIGEDDDHNDGSNDASLEEIEVLPMYIKKNGLTLFDNSDKSR